MRNTTYVTQSGCLCQRASPPFMIRHPIIVGFSGWGLVRGLSSGVLPPSPVACGESRGQHMPQGINGQQLWYHDEAQLFHSAILMQTPSLAPSHCVQADLTGPTAGTAVPGRRSATLGLAAAAAATLFPRTAHAAGIEVLADEEGFGKNEVKNGDLVLVHYVGTVQGTGKVFDTTYGGMPVRTAGAQVCAPAVCPPSTPQDCLLR